jgi:hypothetical protein
MMKKHMEYVYEFRAEAERRGKEWQEYFGYEYSIVEELDGAYVRFRLILDTDQNLMG